MTSRWLVLSMVLMGAGACVVEIDAPDRKPEITVVSDIARTDTIDAEPQGKLVIRISDSTGGLNREVVATIAGMPLPIPSQELGMLPVDTSRAQVGTITTTTRGDVPFFVRFGRHAGPAAIVITVPDLELADTLWFTVNAGAPAYLTLRPGDTSIVLGATYKQDGVIVDRDGNDLGLSSQLSISSGDPGLTVAPTGQITGKAYARAQVRVGYGSIVETAMVSVGPAAKLAGSTQSTDLRIGSTDGTAVRHIPTASFSQLGVRWMPDGAHILYPDNVSTAAGPLTRVFSLSTATGSSTLLIPDSVSALRGLPLVWPSPSYDGNWVFFVALEGTGGSIWRAHSDGTGVEEIVYAPPTLPYTALGSPSLSMDGSRLAYVINGAVRIQNMNDGSTITFAATGATAVRWSPASNRLAVREGTGDLYLMNPDGSGMITIASDLAFDYTLDWSPDGEWLIVALPNPTARTRAAMINVQSRLQLPLSIDIGENVAWGPN